MKLGVDQDYSLRLNESLDFILMTDLCKFHMIVRSNLNVQYIYVCKFPRLCIHTAHFLVQIDIL